jgi:hypothetical protein
MCDVPEGAFCSASAGPPLTLSNWVSPARAGWGAGVVLPPGVLLLGPVVLPLTLVARLRKEGRGEGRSPGVGIRRMTVSV